MTFSTWFVSFVLFLCAVFCGVSCTHSAALEALDTLCDSRPALHQVQQAVDRKDPYLAVKLLRAFVEQHADDEQAKAVLRMLEEELAVTPAP